MTPLRLFLAVTFAFSWACFGGAWASRDVSWGLAVPPAAAFVMAAMLGPALGALVCAFRFMPAGERARRLGLIVTGWKPLAVWIPAAWVLATLFCAASVALSLAIMGSAPADPVASLVELVEQSGKPVYIPPDLLFLIQIGVGLPLGMAVNTVALTFSEELGWRGWLQPHLAGLGFWKMCLVTGAIWGIWHAPIILMGHNYPGLGWGGVLAMIAFCILFTPYVALFRETGASTWAAGALHGALNAVAGVTLLWMPSREWPHMGPIGLEGFALMLAGWAAVWLIRKRRARTAAPAS
ncbi:MAG: CPBP family intramembrane metalloprotease [Hyphomonas sp.]|nr:CPBP family intramembrane metalloprotease [Hyphomonas sp.]